MAAGAAATIPSVRIDNVHDPFATLVTVDMGSAIEMLETVSVRRSHRLLTVSCLPNLSPSFDRRSLL